MRERTADKNQLLAADQTSARSTPACTAERKGSQTKPADHPRTLLPAQTVVAKKRHQCEAAVLQAPHRMSQHNRLQHTAPTASSG